MARTFLEFQHNAQLHSTETVVTAIKPFAALEESNKQLFKNGTDEDHVVITDRTIFHPQGGGQPSDVGSMIGQMGASFTVTAVRMDSVCDGVVLHLGRFGETEKSSIATFKEGETVTQAIDVEKRLLYSRLHTGLVVS